MQNPITGYDAQGAQFAARYERLRAQDVHAAFAYLLSPRADRLVLDIGAGSSRDAAWLHGLAVHLGSGALRNPVTLSDQALPQSVQFHPGGVAQSLLSSTKGAIGILGKSGDILSDPIPYEDYRKIPERLRIEPSAGRPGLTVDPPRRREPVSCARSGPVRAHSQAGS